MAGSAKEIEDDLKSRDPRAWPEFCALREDKKKGGGMDPSAAKDAAYAEIKERYPLDGTAPARGTPPARPTMADVIAKDLKPKSAFAASGKIKHRQTIEWVAEYMWVNDDEPADAPSATAWGLRHWCRMNGDNMTTFYQSMYVKLLPNRAPTEEQDQIDDWDDDYEDMIDRVEKAAFDAGRVATLSTADSGAGSEGPGGEPGVPA